MFLCRLYNFFQHFLFAGVFFKVMQKRLIKLRERVHVHLNFPFLGFQIQLKFLWKCHNLDRSCRRTTNYDRMHYKLDWIRRNVWFKIVLHDYAIRTLTMACCKQTESFDNCAKLIASFTAANAAFLWPNLWCKSAKCNAAYLVLKKMNIIFTRAHKTNRKDKTHK